VTGRQVWSRDILADSGAKLPTWGFAASPLVAKGVVTIFTGGPNGSLLAYDAASGAPAWSAGEGEFSYCSPQLSRVHGVEQLLITTDAGLTALEPAKGKVLWHHEWQLEGGMARVVQPTLVGDADLLVGTGFNMGTRRVRVDRKGDDWTTRAIWTTRSFWPYFNDMVVHRDHIFGFSNNVFYCVNLENGKEKWRARGYGSGQVLLLPDQDLLLVLSEKGEAALLEASPTAHKRLAQFQAIEGKTWNHPVNAHGKLFVRNGEEAACYQLVEISGGANAGRLTKEAER
jgi:outer membrane protein assembly factor BamB